MLDALCIGLGLFAPIGEIGQIITSGNEIAVTCEYGQVSSPARGRARRGGDTQHPVPIISLATSIEVISFSKNELSINTARLSEKVRLRVFKKFYLTAGMGWYFIEVETQSIASLPSIEKDRGTCSFIGLWLPYYIGEKGLLAYETLYSTAPRGISMNLNLGLRL